MAINTMAKLRAVYRPPAARADASPRGDPPGSLAYMPDDKTGRVNDFETT